jgi:hypothetical protein
MLTADDAFILILNDRAHHVRRDLPVMLGAEGSWQFHLHRLRGRKGFIQAPALPGQRLVPFVGLIRHEDRLGLAVRAKGNRFSRRALTPKAGQDARQPCPYLGQRVHLNHYGISYTDGVPKLAQILGIRGGPPCQRGSDRDAGAG